MLHHSRISMRFWWELELSIEGMRWENFLSPTTKSYYCAMEVRQLFLSSVHVLMMRYGISTRMLQLSRLPNLIYQLRVHTNIICGSVICIVSYALLKLLWGNEQNHGIHRPLDLDFARMKIYCIKGCYNLLAGMEMLIYLQKWNFDSIL